MNDNEKGALDKYVSEICKEQPLSDAEEKERADYSAITQSSAERSSGGKLYAYCASLPERMSHTTFSVNVSLISSGHDFLLIGSE